MRNLSNIGRIFYGVSIAEIGLQTIYYHDFPYMLLPPNHSAMPGIVVLAYVFGALFALAGACIVFEKKTRPASLLLGGVLLMIFCFYYVPYQFMNTSRFMHFAEWENAAKELALASGAFVVAGLFSAKDENFFTGFLGKLIPFGIILFAITILSFSIDHFVYGKDAAGYVPAWIPFRVFWIYFAGAALLASAIGIILNIKRGLAATLLGAMIFTWFIILHVPYVINATGADKADEATSAIIALAYCGIAFVIADGVKRPVKKKPVSR